jgi:hypothetical protein
MAEHSLEQKKKISEVDLENAIDKLFIESDNLRFLNRQIKNDKILEDLVKRILEGEKIEYAPYQHLSLSLAGTGPIIRHGSSCAIRNRLYERFLSTVMVNAPAKNDKNQEITGYQTTIYLKEYDENSAESGNEVFLKWLFSPYTVSIAIEWKDNHSRELSLNRTEKLIFCYLAYQNYKAGKEGFLSSMKNYHLSSVPQNNSDQQPEWDFFAEAVNKEGSLYKNSTAPDATIRTTIHKIRHKLEEMGAYDLIPKQQGRGGGYWLEGAVIFCQRDT